jgi:hypothetical protein
MIEPNLRRMQARVAVVCFIAAAVPSTLSADPISVMWDVSADPVSGYVVHVGEQSGMYTRRYDVGPTTSFTFPDAAAGQRYCFAVSAYAAAGQSALSAEVCGYSDAPPRLTNPGNQTSVVGSTVGLQLAGSDPYGQAVTYSATGLPPGLTLGSSSGFITGAGTTAGTYAVTASVFDGRLSASQLFTWTMSPPPVAAPTIAITGPTTGSAYATSGSTLQLRGIASAAAGLVDVRWMNDRGGHGVATGTTEWSVGSVALQTGANVLTVMARDFAGSETTDVLTVTYTAPTSTVTLEARPYVVRGKKFVDLTWTGCAWRLVDVVRDSLPLTTTENDGTYTDSMKKGRTYTYRLCETGNRTNCSNSVAVYF